MLPALDSQFCFLYCKTEKEIFILQDGGGGLWSCLTGVPTSPTGVSGGETPWGRPPLSHL